MSDTIIKGTTDASDTCHYRILINSIGSALPSTSAAVAKGLGLPTAMVVSRLYRAPAVLVDGLDKPLAQRMLSLLSDIGYEAEMQEETEPVPAPVPLYDVAIYIEDAQKFQHAVDILAKFIGITEAEATKMIMAPPGIVLGAVSEATIRIFKDQMGEKISVISSQSEKAYYDLFLSDGPDVVRNHLLADIAKAGISSNDTLGLVASNVDYKTAQDLWKRHQTSGLLRIVNQDFLRFDLVLHKTETPDQEHVKALELLAGVPADMAEAVFSETPITLLEAVPSAEVAAHMEAFAKARLNVQANLITFQTLGLEVQSISNHASLLRTLEKLGLSKQGTTLPRPPFRIPGVMPELQARIIRTAIEDAGAQVTFTEEMN